MNGKHTGCSVTTLWLLEGAAGLVGCIVTVLAFQLPSVDSSAWVDLKKLKLNMLNGGGKRRGKEGSIVVK
jgi:hypothetical protein